MKKDPETQVLYKQRNDEKCTRREVMELMMPIIRLKAESRQRSK